MLAVLRPNAPIVGLEDPAAYQRALERKHENDTQESRQREVSALTTEAKKELERLGLTPDHVGLAWFSLLDRCIKVKAYHRAMEFSQNEVDGPRSMHLLNNLRRYREEHGGRKASIINAGAAHHDRVPGILRQEEGWSFVRIRPAGFPAVPGLAQQPKGAIG